MGSLPGEARSAVVRRIFDRIAPRYDLLNRLLSLGQDRRWRAETIARLEPKPEQRLLDVGTGTGRLALEARRIQPGLRVVGCDFSRRMLLRNRRRLAESGIALVLADAMQLPFAGRTFDLVTSAFVLRNLGDLDRGLMEQHRVLRPGGRASALETAPAPRSFLGRLALLYLRLAAPLLGRLFAGEGPAYDYLVESTASFHYPAGIGERFRRAGFTADGHTVRMGSMVAIHWAERPGTPPARSA